MNQAQMWPSKIRRGRSISPIASSKAVAGDKPPLFRKGRDVSAINAARQVPKFIKSYHPSTERKQLQTAEAQPNHIGQVNSFLDENEGGVI